jgi:protoheme ferro-lyase
MPMPAAAKEYERIGQTAGAADHDRDLVHELSRRLDEMWRLDQYIANADGKPRLQEFWRDLKQQEHRNIQQLKGLVAEEVRAQCF